MIDRYSLQAEINRQTALSKQIADLQTSVSTGSRIQSASDDPAAAATAAQINRTQSDATVYSANIKSAQAIASSADTTLSSVQTAIAQAQELVLQGKSGTLSDDDRASLATQLRDIASQIASYSQTTDANGNPLFSTGSALQIPVAKGTAVTASASYDDVFGNFSTSDGTTTSLGDMLNAAADAMDSGDTDGLGTAITNLTAATSHVADAQADQGVREQRLTTMSDQLTANGTALTTQLTNLTGTDLTTAVATLNAKLLTLQAAQSVLAQVNKSTLFDVIS